jgi:hypothetical protein
VGLDGVVVSAVVGGSVVEVTRDAGGVGAVDGAQAPGAGGDDEAVPVGVGAGGELDA